MFRFSEIIEDLISRKLTFIFWGIIWEYFIRLWTYDHGRIYYDLWITWHRHYLHNFAFVRHPCITLHLSDITCTTLHVSGITCRVLYLSLDIVTIYIARDIDTHCFHYLTLLSLTLFPDHIHWVTHYFALTLINKINQARVTGGRL